MKSVILLVCHFMPLAYLAMMVDFLKGSVISYVLMMVILGALLVFAVKTNNLMASVLGNILTLTSSLFFAYSFPCLGWETFFKPLAVYQMIIFLSVIASVIQLIIYFCIRKKN